MFLVVLQNLKPASGEKVFGTQIDQVYLIATPKRLALPSLSDLLWIAEGDRRSFANAAHFVKWMVTTYHRPPECFVTRFIGCKIEDKPENVLKALWQGSCSGKRSVVCSFG